MIKLLQILWYGHQHKWNIIEKREVRDNGGLIGTRYTCQCQHCGNIKAFNNF